MSSVPPSRSQPASDWVHYQLYERVRASVYAVSAHFQSGTTIEGVVATDLQTLNQVIGATIEEQVVATLNRMRRVWDPEGEYFRYSFRRQAQVFPDVLLMAEENGRDVILGIELKGWYLLAKEQMPNFRFQITPAACAAADLLVVVPWALDNVLSGRPVTHKPFIESARYAAEHRNYWWTEVRETRADRRIISPEDVTPYPSKSDRIADRPVTDGGGNFGRLARTGLMDAYIQETLDVPLAGIPVERWLEFLRQLKQ